jgi:VCBS repeat-containing protein
VLANDTDADTTHVFTLVSATAPANKGTASVVGNQVQFVPGTDFDHLAQGASENVVINYTMQDDHGVTSSSTLTMMVNGVNDAPTSSNASVSGTENDASIGGTLTASDVDDGAVLTFGLVAGSVKIDGSTVADGTVTVNADGTYSYTPGAADNALNVGEHRTVSFDFSVSDGIASIQKTATITVNGVNDAPTANADTGSTAENTAANFDVLANDADADTTHVFTLNSASAPVGKGTASVVSNEVHFDPGTAFDHLAVGAHEDVVIAYTMQDDHGVTSSSTVTVTVNGVNDAPTATADAKYLNEDTSVIVSTRSAGVLGNDSDKDDGETATLKVVGAHAGTAADTTVAASGTTSVVGTYGTLHIAADGTYSYTADSSAAQALAQSSTANGFDVFHYTTQDAQGATVTSTLTFNIKGQDDAAIARDDALATTEDAASGGSLFTDHGSGADSDVDGPALSIAAVNGSAANVGTQITLASGALLTVNADGSYSYDPNGAFNDLAAFGSGATNERGSDSFTYTLANGNTATVTVDIHGVASAGDRMEGSTGDDTITGTPMADLFMLQDGGFDSASGGDGNDGFYLGGALTADDNLDGGAGTLDQLGLQGDYSAGLTLGANNLVNTEMLVLLSGSDTRFGDTGGNLYSYDITTVDENVATGQQLAVSWNKLGIGENVTFDGSGETDGSFLTFAGAGTDTITGSQQDDGFYFGYGMWGAGDSVDGQGGTHDQLGLQGDYSLGGAGPVVFGATQLSGIEIVVCMTSVDTRFGVAAGDGYSYDLTMDDGNVGAGQTLYISANKLMAADGVTLTSDETLTFNGAAETDGRFVIYSGAGADTIVGGAGDDTLYGAGGADTLTGGAGNDVFAYISADHSTASAMDHILDFTSGDRIDLSAIDAIAGTPGDDPFTLIDSNPFSNTAGELRFEHAAGNDWLVQGDINGDSTADFQVMLTIPDAHPLGAGDFVL